MKIQIYGINFFPELTGIGKYTGELSFWLAQQGHDVTVITAPPYYPEWKVGTGYFSRRYKTEQLDGINVIRCPLWVPERPTGLQRLLHLASFSISSLPALYWALRHKPQVVIVVAPALFCAPAAWLAARLAGAKCWLHIQDFEVDAAFDMGLLKGKFLKKIVLRLEGLLLSSFDRVSTISERMLALLQDKLGAKKSAVLFPNWVDLKHIYPLSGPIQLRQELGIPDDKLVLLYSGNMGQKQGLDMLIDAARCLVDNPQFVFLMCGDGVAKVRLKTASADLPNMHWIPLQPIERLNELLSLADIHLLPQSANVADLVMPSKLTGMLASGKPIIATAMPETQVAKVVSNAGKVVLPNDIPGLVDAIVSLANNRNMRDQFGRAGRDWIEQHWDKEKILSTFEQDLLQLIGE